MNFNDFKSVFQCKRDHHDYFESFTAGIITLEKYNRDLENHLKLIGLKIWPRKTCD